MRAIAIWYELNDLLPIIGALRTRQTHIFSVGDDVRKNEELAELEQEKSSTRPCQPFHLRG
jgi:hypothetical protein